MNKVEIWEKVYPPQKRTIFLRNIRYGCVISKFCEFPSLRFRIGYHFTECYFKLDYLQVHDANTGKILRKIGGYDILNVCLNSLDLYTTPSDETLAICLGYYFKLGSWGTLDSLVNGVVGKFWDSEFTYNE